MPHLHQVTCRPDTSIPDEQLVSGYKWIQLVSGRHVSWCKRGITQLDFLISLTVWEIRVLADCWRHICSHWNTQRIRGCTRMRYTSLLLTYLLSCCGSAAVVMATNGWRHAGNLHFANIMASDELSERQPYVCVLSNDLLRSLVQGEDQRIVPQSVTGARRGS